MLDRVIKARCPQRLLPFSCIKLQCTEIHRPEKEQHEHIRNLRQGSHLVPGQGARVRYLLDTNVNTSKLQVPKQAFGHSASIRVQGLWVPVSTPFFESSGAVHRLVLTAKLKFQNGV